MKMFSQFSAVFLQGTAEGGGGEGGYRGRSLSLGYHGNIPVWILGSGVTSAPRREPDAPLLDFRQNVASIVCRFR